ncbi:hypothetical protein I540_0304 [Mycobacteroides abscessus subsp. bolletii 1513]|uniref:Uncharacterized protein n=1 Tax=Mycobacteroides abscessus subsp. bolletii 1513 TaxID=1299321 RepID=X8DZU3_9MYCO|nr:hypothetical protein I540_0304 [Mycobacteroides abscessus subsp. bolletii 1513]
MCLEAPPPSIALRTMIQTRSVSSASPARFPMPHAGKAH